MITLALIAGCMIVCATRRKRRPALGTIRSAVRVGAGILGLVLVARGHEPAFTCLDLTSWSLLLLKVVRHSSHRDGRAGADLHPRLQ